MKNEIWKPIVGFENLYEISNYGRVKSLPKKRGRFIQKGKILKLKIKKTGYQYIDLHKNGINKTFSVHRLVALTFIPNPENLPCVNHKDETRINNYVENLEWCTHKYNTNYGTCHKKTEIKRKKAVLQFDKNNNFIKEWDSAKDVENNLNIASSSICHVCKCKLKTAGGFIWKYKDEIKSVA